MADKGGATWEWGVGGGVGGGAFVSTTVSYSFCNIPGIRYVLLYIYTEATYQPMLTAVHTVCTYTKKQKNYLVIYFVYKYHTYIYTKH